VQAAIILNKDYHVKNYKPETEGDKMRFYVLCCLFFLICGISTPSYAAVIGENDEEVEGVADPLLDNVLSGFSDEDYSKYSKDFDETLKSTITPRHFKEIREQVLGSVGKYLYREYLGFLNREAITIVLWKGVFDKTQDEVLIKMVVSEQNGRYLITGLWYQ